MSISSCVEESPNPSNVETNSTCEFYFTVLGNADKSVEITVDGQTILQDSTWEQPLKATEISFQEKIVLSTPSKIIIEVEGNRKIRRHIQDCSHLGLGINVKGKFFERRIEDYLFD